MDIAKDLEQTKKKQQEIVAQINALEQQKQQLIPEALRLDGEVRLLQRLVAEEQSCPTAR